MRKKVFISSETSKYCQWQSFTNFWQELPANTVNFNQCEEKHQRLMSNFPSWKCSFQRNNYIFCQFPLIESKWRTGLEPEETLKEAAFYPRMPLSKAKQIQKNEQPLFSRACCMIYWTMTFFFCCLVAQSCPTLWPHGMQHARLPYPSPSPRVCPSSWSLHQWCPSHPLTPSSPSALDLSQHQGLFQWVVSLKRHFS